MAIPPAAELERWIGPPLRDVFVSIVGDEHAVRAVEVFRERMGTVGIFENVLYHGIAETLEVLETKTDAMYIATSKPRVYAERIADHFGIRRFFRGIYGAELTGERAKKGELLDHLLAEEGLTPSKNIAMIGDRKYDVLAAHAHGLRSIGVTWGYGTADELREAGADRICASIPELIEAVVD